MRKLLIASVVGLILGCFLVACADTATTPVSLPTATILPTSTPDPLVWPSYNEVKAILAGGEEKANSLVGTDLVNWHGWVTYKLDYADPPYIVVHIEDPFAEELLPNLTNAEWANPEVNPTALAVNEKLKARSKNLFVALQELTASQAAELVAGQEIRFGGKVESVFGEDRYGSRSFFGIVDVQYRLMPLEHSPDYVIKDQESAQIHLERGACYGPCPLYSLDIKGDGTVTYEGTGNVRVCGTQTTQISMESVAELIYLFEKADFFALRNYKEPHEHDSPYYYVSLTLNGKTHEVTHYTGDVTSPTRLGILEDRIDELTNSEQWVGGSSKEHYVEQCDAPPVASPTR